MKYNAYVVRFLPLFPRIYFHYFQFMRQYANAACEFINKLNTVVSPACELLGSKTQSDVQEAVKLLETLFLFKLPSAEVSHHSFVNILV